MGLLSNPPNAAVSLRVLARLLSYPDATLRQNLCDMREALHADKTVPASRLLELDALIATLEHGEAPVSYTHLTLPTILRV